MQIKRVEKVRRKNEEHKVILTSFGLFKFILHEIPEIIQRLKEI
jgi:hypothetical protein